MPQVTQKQFEQGMDCIVIGGCADGTILQKIRMDAQFINLKRPDYIKPVETPDQAIPDVVNESDDYEVHAISLVNSDASPGRARHAVFGLAVVAGMSLTDAFSELCKSHVEIVTQRLMRADLVSKQ